jgi:transposase-like protein
MEILFLASVRNGRITMRKLNWILKQYFALFLKEYGWRITETSSKLLLDLKIPIKRIVRWIY